MRWDGYGVSAILLALLCAFAAVHAEDPAVSHLTQLPSTPGLEADEFQELGSMMGYSYPHDAYKHKHGSKKCGGAITAIYCKEGRGGKLTSIAYLNEASGLHLPGCADGDWTNHYSKAMWLAEGESVIKVSQCKAAHGKRDGACVTFYTDGGQELECGQLPDKSYFSPGHSKDPYGRGAHLMTTAALSSDASHDVEAPDGANRTAVQSPSHSGDATATRTARHNHKQSRGRHGRKHHKDANSDAKSGKAPSRVLLEAEAMDNKRYNLPDGYGAYDGVYETKKRYYIPSTKPSGRHYYGQPGETSPVGPAGPGPTKCSVDSAPHQPEWTGVSDWWSIKANDDHPLGMAGGRGLDAYFVWDNTHYFKAMRTYITERELHYTDRGHGHGPHDYTPAYYYNEVWPLAGFKVDCKDDECLSGFKDFCWNGHYNTTKPDGVPGTGEIELSTDVPCPKTPAQISTLQRDLATISDRLREASDGVISYMWWQRYTPDMCSDATPLVNATITLNLIFVPGHGYTNDKVRQWLVANTGNDLCEVSYASMSICAGTTISTLPIAFALRQSGRQLLVAGSDRPGSEQVPVQTRGIEASLPSMDGFEGLMNFEMVGDMPIV